VWWSRDVVSGHWVERYGDHLRWTGELFARTWPF